MYICIYNDFLFVMKLK